MSQPGWPGSAETRVAWWTSALGHLQVSPEYPRARNSETAMKWKALLLDEMTNSGYTTVRRTAAFLCLSRIGELTVFQRIKSSGFNLQIKFTNHTVIPAVSTQHIRSRMHLNLTRRAWPYVPPNQVLVLAHVDNQMPAHNCIRAEYTLIEIGHKWKKGLSLAIPISSLRTPLGPELMRSCLWGKKCEAGGA